jgi:hypothetical protein
VRGDNVKLFRLIEQQLLAAGEDVDFPRAWQIFSRYDRDHRNRMSRDQVNNLCSTAIFHRCHINAGQRVAILNEK